jgi:hypothetical protein
MFSDSFLNAPPPKTLEIGQVIGGGFSAMRRNWLTFLVVGFVFYVAPTAAYGWLAGSARPLTPADVTQLTPAYGVYLLYLFGFTFILQPLFAAMIAWTVWVDEAGNRPTLAETVRAVLPQAPWIIVANFVFALLVGLGAFLVLIPGLIAATAFYVTIPACVTEKLGPRASLTRSLELTRGQRWRILALYVVLLLIGVAFGALAGLASMMAGFTFADARSPLVIVLRALLNGVSAVFGAACTGSAYVELRALREGASSRNVAEVFA